MSTVSYPSRDHKRLWAWHATRLQWFFYWYPSLPWEGPCFDTLKSHLCSRSCFSVCWRSFISYPWETVLGIISYPEDWWLRDRSNTSPSTRRTRTCYEEGVCSDQMGEVFVMACVMALLLASMLKVFFISLPKLPRVSFSGSTVRIRERLCKIFRTRGIFIALCMCVVHELHRSWNKVVPVGYALAQNAFPVRGIEVLWTRCGSGVVFVSERLPVWMSVPVS